MDKNELVRPLVTFSSSRETSMRLKGHEFLAPREDSARLRGRALRGAMGREGGDGCQDMVHWEGGEQYWRAWG